MLIDGREIASEIINTLKKKVINQKIKGQSPHLAVILVGNDLGSTAYVRAKKSLGKEVGIKVSIYPHQIANNEKMINDLNHLSLDKKQLVELVSRLNKDPSVHGIIIQRPLPIDITKEELDLLVVPKKDVDGFHPQTRFDPPIAKAVERILFWVYRNETNKLEHWSIGDLEHFYRWLCNKPILVIGRGETAGKPIAKYLLKKGAQVTIAHSKTENLTELCQKSNIIISCVGKGNRNNEDKSSILRSTEGSRNNGTLVVRHSMVNNKTILIGVGLHNEEGKLRTDYDPDEIKDTVAYYTPVPGGVGPVNVACLMENAIKSASK